MKDRVPDALACLLGDMEDYDRASLDRLQDWAIRSGMTADPTAFFLLAFMVSHFIKHGASPLTVSRFVAQVGELAQAEIERRRQ